MCYKRLLKLSLSFYVKYSKYGMGKDYIDKFEYHEEMVKCKKASELSNKVIAMFTIHATEVSKAYWFSDEEERKDAIASAMHDFVCYWKNFKESNVIQLKLVRNFRLGETITLDICNYGVVTYTAGTKTNETERTFKIKDTTNHSLQELHDLVAKDLIGVVEPSLHKVTMKITFMDIHNANDLSVKSRVGIYVKDATKDEYPELIYVHHKKISKILKSLDVLEYNKRQVEKHINKIELDSRNKKATVDTFKEQIEKIISLLGAETLEQMMDDVGKALTKLDKTCDENGVYVHEFTDPPNAFNFFTSYCHNGILKGINKTSPKNTRNGVLLNLGSINNDSNGMYNL